MNPITKIVFVVIGTIMLTNLFACTPTVTINAIPEQVSKTAADIADFELPPGYRVGFTANLLGYTLAAFHPGDGGSHLYLIQSENEADGFKLEAALYELEPNSRDSHTRMTVIETRPAIVRGQDVLLVISEGANSERITYRQVTATFQGKGGPAMLVLSEPVEHWNQETVDAFLASIH